MFPSIKVDSYSLATFLSSVQASESVGIPVVTWKWHHYMLWYDNYLMLCLIRQHCYHHAYFFTFNFCPHSADIIHINNSCCFSEANVSEISCTVTVIGLNTSTVGEERLSLLLEHTDHNLVCNQSLFSVIVEVSEWCPCTILAYMLWRLLPCYNTIQNNSIIITIHYSTIQ